MSRSAFIKKGLLFTSVIITTLLTVEMAHAHRPVFTKDLANSADTAIPMQDAQISQVVYREITKKSPKVWLTFSAPKDLKLFVQIGVPHIDRLKDFRPAMVVIGPGLPQDNPPFELPKGMGFKLLETDKVEKPRFFHEHFTNTDSWILRGETITLSKPGRCYLVAYSPENRSYGKLWLSIGKKEVFSRKDWKEFPKWRRMIQEFHEVKRK